MDTLTRRLAIGIGVLGGAVRAAGHAGANTDEEPNGASAVLTDEPEVVFVGEKAVLFKIKDLTLDAVDEPARTIDATVGQSDRPLKLANVPLEDDVRIRVSFVFPGVANNLPFNWE